MDEVQEAAIVQANLEALPDDPTAEQILQATTGYSDAAVQIALKRTGGSGNGGSQPGAVIVRGPFDFAYNTPGINNGVAFYTPTVGDILLDAWIEVLTAFDGTQPKADFGPFLSGQTAGYYGGPWAPVLLTDADADAITGSIPSDQGLLAHPFGSGRSLLVNSLAASNGYGGMSRKIVPGKITAADPWLLVVSQDGTRGGAAIDSTQGAGRLYIVTATPAAFS